jgi:hypothetical protein
MLFTILSFDQANSYYSKVSLLLADATTWSVLDAAKLPQLMFIAVFVLPDEQLAKKPNFEFEFSIPFYVSSSKQFPIAIGNIFIWRAQLFDLGLLKTLKSKLGN